MPAEAKVEPENSFMTIAQVRNITHVLKSTLRDWEVEFGWQIQQTTDGQRKYTLADVEKIKKISELYYNQGLTIEEIKRRLRLEIKTQD